MTPQKWSYYNCRSQLSAGWKTYGHRLLDFEKINKETDPMRPISTISILKLFRIDRFSETFDTAGRVTPENDECDEK